MTKPCLQFRETIRVLVKELGAVNKLCRGALLKVDTGMFKHVTGEIVPALGRIVTQRTVNSCLRRTLAHVTANAALTDIPLVATRTLKLRFTLFCRFCNRRHHVLPFSVVS
ncbi:hypothetical protein J6590_014942 [Homalodisca vitripennis]|nr:hypothetical protein J6590_014942 [Homalodisca vitripennis]